MITQDEAVKAVNLMVSSLSEQAQKFPQEQYLLVSLEIAQHLCNYISQLSDNKSYRLSSGDEFKWRGYKCKVA